VLRDNIVLPPATRTLRTLVEISYTRATVSDIREADLSCVQDIAPYFQPVLPRHPAIIMGNGQSRQGSLWIAMLATLMISNMSMGREMDDGIWSALDFTFNPTFAG